MRISLLIAWFLLLTLARLFAPQAPSAISSKERDDAGARAAFVDAYKVFMHPRCVNCHPAGDAPLRGEDSQPHAGLRLRRGPDGQGVFTLKCTNCHQSQNQQGLQMPPGAPNVLSDGSLDLTRPRWHLPSANTQMIFQGRSAAQLCRQLQDPKQNGGLTSEQLLHHISSDPLVLWGWNPGEGRKKPPLTHDEFVFSVREWLEKGGACPK
jgi:hypothetical protein